MAKTNALTLKSKKAQPLAATKDVQGVDLMAEQRYGAMRDSIKGRMLSVSSSAQNVMEQTAMTYWDVGHALAEYVVGKERTVANAKDREEVMQAIPGPLLQRLSQDLNQEGMFAQVSDSLLRGMARMSVTFTKPEMSDAIVVNGLAHSHMDVLTSVADDDTRKMLLSAAKTPTPDGRRMSVEALKKIVAELPISKLTPDSQVQRKRTKTALDNKLKDVLTMSSKLTVKINNTASPIFHQVTKTLGHHKDIPDDKLAKGKEALGKLIAELEDAKQSIEASLSAATTAVNAVQGRIAAQKSEKKSK